MPQAPEIELPIKANADHFVRTARVIARHLTALADELEHGEPPLPFALDAQFCRATVPCGKILADGECSRHGRQQ